MRPAACVGEAAALRVRTVTIAQQRAREVPDAPLHVLVRPARRVVKHQFVVLPVNRPAIRRANLVCVRIGETAWAPATPLKGLEAGNVSAQI